MDKDNIKHLEICDNFSCERCKELKKDYKRCYFCLKYFKKEDICAINSRNSCKGCDGVEKEGIDISFPQKNG